MITWKIPDAEEGDNEKNETLQETKTEFADKCLIASVKIVSEIRRNQDIAIYNKNPIVKERFPDGFNSSVSFGLHYGWTIEGAIGSNQKIDACYLSPHVQITEKIESLCKYYDVPILLTESLYSLMSLKARNTLRKIDVCLMRESKDPIGLFTFDISAPSEEE
jgi:class 3 adenylate cyclase